MRQRGSWPASRWGTRGLDRAVQTGGDARSADLDDSQRAALGAAITPEDTDDD